MTRPSLREGCATGGRGFADRPSWPAATAARSLAPPACTARGLFRPPPPRHRGSQSKKLLLLRFPLGRGERAEDQPEGARAGGACVRCQYTDVRSANPAARSRSLPDAEARQTAAARVPFLLVTSLWASKEKSLVGHGWQKTQGCEPVFATRFATIQGAESAASRNDQVGGYNTPAFVQNASKNTRRKPNTPFRSRSVSKGKARLAPGFSVTPESGSVYEPGFSTFSSVRRLRARPSFVEFVSIGCDSPKPLTAVMRLGSTPCEVR